MLLLLQGRRVGSRRVRGLVAGSGGEHLGEARRGRWGKSKDGRAECCFFFSLFEEGAVGEIKSFIFFFLAASFFFLFLASLPKL